MKKQEEFTTLRTFNNQGEAELTKALLDSAGIDCFIRGGIVSTVMPFFNETTGIDLVVRTEDVLCAEQFLQAEIEK